MMLPPTMRIFCIVSCMEYRKARRTFHRRMPSPWTPTWILWVDVSTSGHREFFAHYMHLC